MKSEFSYCSIFKIVPVDFYQPLIMHCLVRYAIIPLFICEAEKKLASRRYTAEEFLQIVSHLTEIFRKIGRCGIEAKKTENDVPFMSSDDHLECFEIECNEDERLNKIFASENEFIFARKHVGISCADSTSKKTNG